MHSSTETAGSAPGFNLHRTFAHLTGAMAALATGWIFLLMFAICADVLGLKLFNRPIYGVVEITAQSIAAVVFFQLAHALETGRLTRADFVITVMEKSHPAAAQALATLFSAAGIVVFALIGWTVWGDFLNALAEGEYFGSRGLFAAPIWPIKLMVSLGAFAVAIEFCFAAWHAARRMGRFMRAGQTQGFWVVGFLLFVFAVLGALFFLDLDRVTVGVVMIVVLLVMIIMGMHIAVALMGIAVLGIWIVRDNPVIAIRALKTAATGSINKFDFGVVPLFVLMGMLVDVADVGRDAFKVAAWGLRRLRGGLGVATVAANAVFAAVTGISIASAAVFSRVAVPQMMDHGYSARFAAGAVAGSSVLGMLIPPSLLLIIFGFVAETSVGSLFLAAIIPGIVLATAFAAMILGFAYFRPQEIGDFDTQTDDIEPETLGSALSKLAPIVLLVAVVLGGIYTGWFTPTQAGAIGAAAALIIALGRRKLDLRTLWRVLQETAQISVSILVLIIAASAFTKMLAISTLPREMIDLVIHSGLSLWPFMMAYLAVIIVMGMFLDSTSIILIVVPLTMGVAKQLGLDVIGPDVLVWYGIVTVIAVEIGLLTPPFGITVYVVKAALHNVDVTLMQIFRGVAPFVVVMLIVTLLVIFFPALSLVWF